MWGEGEKLRNFSEGQSSHKVFLAFTSHLSHRTDTLYFYQTSPSTLTPRHMSRSPALFYALTLFFFHSHHTNLTVLLCELINSICNDWTRPPCHCRQNRHLGFTMHTLQLSPVICFYCFVIYSSTNRSPAFSSDSAPAHLLINDSSPAYSAYFILTGLQW